MEGKLGVIPNTSIRLPHAQACTCIFTHTHETGKKKEKKFLVLQGLVVHACNPRSLEAWAVNMRSAWICSETLSPNKTEKSKLLLLNYTLVPINLFASTYVPNMFYFT